MGNHYLEKQEKENIGEDVLVHNEIAMLWFRLYEGGVEIRFTNRVDIGGNIPTFVKNFGTKELIEAH